MLYYVSGKYKLIFEQRDGDRMLEDIDFGEVEKLAVEADSPEAAAQEILDRARRNCWRDGCGEPKATWCEVEIEEVPQDVVLRLAGAPPLFELDA